MCFQLIYINQYTGLLISNFSYDYDELRISLIRIGYPNEDSVEIVKRFVGDAEVIFQTCKHSDSKLDCVIFKMTSDVDNYRNTIFLKGE